MNDYISKEMALKKLQMQLLDLEADQDKGEYSELCENRGARDALDEAIYDIRAIKPADVQPVKHGRWIIADDVEHFIAVCSECGRIEDSRCIKDMPYCHCGAKMDLKDGDTNG